MEFVEASIKDVLVITPKRFEDDRGYFFESYHLNRYRQVAGINLEFVQDNFSKSRKSVLRGLHYQIKHPQGKLLYVLQGEIFDVVVDIRRSSKTFGQHVEIILSSENNKQLWIPPGFAHGFYVLSEWAEIVYKVTDFYYPEWDRTLLWNDPKLKINWPILPSDPVYLSEKDKQGKSFDEAELFD